MDLAAKHGLPVPKTYETYESDQASSQRLGARTSGWIRVDFVDGNPLEDMWVGLEEREKLSICHQLRDLLRTMRAIESPTPGIISSCDGTGIRDRRAIADEHGGPFSTEAEFNEFIRCFAARVLPAALNNAIRSQMKTRSRVVLTHCDLSPRNIMVKDDKITALLDWEDGGFFPEYYEYVRVFDVSHRI